MVRFLHLQRRRAERDLGGQNYQPVDELTTASGSWVTWDEAVESEFSLGPMEFADPAQPWSWPIVAAAACDIEAVDGGRLVRERQEVRATVTVSVEAVGVVDRVSVTVRNTGTSAATKEEAIATSLIGTHVIGEAVGGEFVSLLEPPDAAEAAHPNAASTGASRCSPGPPATTICC